MNHGRQQKLDFPRGEQLALLRAAVLPATVTTATDRHGRPVGGVRGSLLKAVLKAIDDHGRGRECYVKVETLATEVGCSIPQLKRAIKALKSLSLVCCERKRTPKGPPCNHYRIVWTELALLDSRNARKQSITVNNQSIMVNEQSITGETCNRKRTEAHKEPPPPANTEAESGCSTTTVEVEESLFRHARAIGLFDVDAVSVALTNGWSDTQLRELFTQFQNRRGRWNDTIHSPCGLLRSWLRTLSPSDPIPWPDPEPRRKRTPKLSEQERANNLVMDLRRRLQREDKDLQSIERLIRKELREQGFTPEVCCEAGYSLDGD